MQLVKIKWALEANLIITKYDFSQKIFPIYKPSFLK